MLIVGLFVGIILVRQPRVFIIENVAQSKPKLTEKCKKKNLFFSSVKFCKKTAKIDKKETLCLKAFFARLSFYECLPKFFPPKKIFNLWFLSSGNSLQARIRNKTLVSRIRLLRCAYITARAEYCAQISMPRLLLRIYSFKLSFVRNCPLLRIVASRTFIPLLLHISKCAECENCENYKIVIWS